MSFSKDGFSQGSENQVLLRVFLMFSVFFNHSGWEPTCSGILGQHKREIKLEIPPSKKVEFLDFWGVMKNSGNLQQDGQKNFQN